MPTQAGLTVDSMKMIATAESNRLRALAALLNDIREGRRDGALKLSAHDAGLLADGALDRALTVIQINKWLEIRGFEPCATTCATVNEPLLDHYRRRR